VPEVDLAGVRATVVGRVRAWVRLARPPFHTVGVLPFILGAVLAWRLGGVFRWQVAGWGTLGVVLIMLATYFAGEYWDAVEDALSARHGRSRFAGGSGVVQERLLPPRAPLWGSVVALVLAAGVGLVLQLGYRTGPWTIPLGVVGMVGGFLYSTRPVRWVTRGWGEVWIAFCYGWLPVAVGSYLQLGRLVPIVHWLALPIGLTILNVILLNEFPDYPADVASGKRNLTVRLGPERAAWLYVLVAGLAWVGVALTYWQGAPPSGLWLHVPVLVLSGVAAVGVARRGWRERPTLERLCAATLAVNLGVTGGYVVAYLT